MATRPHLPLLALLTFAALLGAAAPAGRTTASAALARQHAAPSPTETAATTRPSCTPERAATAPCQLAPDQVNGPFQFGPDESLHAYQIDLGPDAGLVTTISLIRAPGLELRATISRPDEGRPLATIALGAGSAEIPADVSGLLRIQVENRSVGAEAEGRYKIEVRRSLPPPVEPPDGLSDRDGVPVDPLENNWSQLLASEIALGSTYDLTFACPEAWGGACPGGDIDYLRVPVKAGLVYRISTFDLGPDVDTVLRLFWASQHEIPAAANDDASAGAALSMLVWRAPGDGDLVIQVAPRNGPRQPALSAEGDDLERRGRYRIAVTLLGSAPDAKVYQRLLAQAPALAPPSPTRAAPPAGGAPGGPGATATVTVTATAGSPTPTADPRTAPTSPIQSGAAQGGRPTAQTEDGPAITTRATTMYLDPSADSPVLARLPAQTVLRLRGPTFATWVLVETSGDVLPGWVEATHLQRTLLSLPALPTPVGTPVAVGPAAPPGPAPIAGPAGSTSYQVTRLSALAAAPPQARPPHVPLSVAVQLLAVEGAPVRATPAPGGAPDPGQPRALAGVRIQLVNAFGDVLAETLSDAGGLTTLTIDIAPGTLVWAQLPALGLRARVEPSAPTIVITLSDQEVQP